MDIGLCHRRHFIGPLHVHIAEVNSLVVTVIGITAPKERKIVAPGASPG
jgi:hypothetical protein